MTAQSIDEQLVAYLTDAHAIEAQALAQMRAAPGLAGDPGLAEAFRAHLAETERHERLVRARLEEKGAAPSRVKDLAGRGGGKAFVLFARSQPDTTGKLVAHALSYEHLEWAAYELLRHVARRARDAHTEALAVEIRDEEAAMAERIEASFDRAVGAAMDEKDPGDLDAQLVRYLADAHAIENQAIGLLSRAPGLVHDAQLATLFDEHLDETRGHVRLVEARLAAHDAGPSAIKDAAMGLGALNWGAFFAAQPDTPAKLAGFAHAFEFLEVGAYEELRRVAERAGDRETARTAEAILVQERAAARKVAAHFDRAVDAALRDVGVAA
jgi:ferritin-like metal-binding protein YciE